jgi:RNA 3'-terminal phosphate cyclase (ATP)
MIEIDGSEGEGGGQVLRTSLALSLLTGKSFHLRNIRARRRPKPGLQAQHLTSVRAAATVGNAQVRGVSLHSSDLVFEPGRVQPGNYRFDIGTAGATSLVLQTVYLPLALKGTAPSELTLTGGTHVRASPSFHFLDFTWRGHLENFGLITSLSLKHPGFYPRGGGEVQAVVQPATKVRGMQIPERGPVRIHAISAGAGLPENVSHRQADQARKRLKQHGHKVDIDIEQWDGDPGSVLVLAADSGHVPATFVGLGERGKPAEKVADEAVDELLHFLAQPAPVDVHSSDQIVLPLALAEGPSQFAVTAVAQHLLTNIAVIRRFLDREIICEGVEGQPGRVTITP